MILLYIDLDPGKSYEIRITGKTEEGWIPEKDTMYWIPVPPWRFGNKKFKGWNTFFDEYFAPPLLELEDVNSTSALLQWTEPLRPKKIMVEGFRITYSTLTERRSFFHHGLITIYDGKARQYSFNYNNGG